MFNYLVPNLFANTALYIVLPIIGLAVGAAAALLLYMLVTKNKIGNVRKSANKLVEDAVEEAKLKRKEVFRETESEIEKKKSEFERQRADFEREMKDKRSELQRSEQRVYSKEDLLNKKEEALDKKIEGIEQTKARLSEREEEIKKIKAEAEAVHSQMIVEVEKAAAMTREEAKAKLMEAIEEEAKIDAAKFVREAEATAKEEADKKAREIVAQAVQRCAVDHSSEITVSVVSLPSEEMKGRIIGREGRNIRALETATGVDLIIDDTPEAVVLSAFDPIRREIARITLEKLISDGRIHPARIEEMVEKTRKELDVKVKELGESAMFDAGVFGLHADLIKLLGRLQYRTSYGQNVLKHSLEVSHLAGLMATELGADVNICKRAGLLHDIGKAIDHEVEGTHVSIGADLAKKYKENKEIVHCIAAHHNDVDPETVEAVIVQCADAISGARPGARRESLDNYVKRLEKLESIANGFKGVEKSYAIQAGREVRILVKPEIIKDEATLFLAKDIAAKIEQEMEYPGQIKVNVIRETRSVEYAK